MAKPFIKWAGGKRQLMEHLLSRLPSDFGDDEYPNTQNRLLEGAL